MNTKEIVKQIATTNFKHSETKLEQKTRNQLRTSLLDALKNDLTDLIDTQDCSVLVTEKGVTLAIDNEQVGYISIELVPTFKNLDFEPFESAENKEQMVEMAKQRQEKRIATNKAKIELQKAQKERHEKLNEVKKNRSSGQDY